MNRIVLSALCLLSVLSCSDSTTPTTNGSTIEVKDDFFDPTTLNVPTGTTVTWTWAGSVAHQVVSDNGVFASSDLQGAGTHTATFSSPGTYNYHCAIHGGPGTGMHGTIVVSGDSVGGPSM